MELGVTPTGVYDGACMGIFVCNLFLDWYGDVVMEYSSWQFWLVTLIFVTALAVLLKPFFTKGKGGNSCCSTKSKPKKTDLTIDGK